MSAAALLGAGASIFGSGINWLANEQLQAQNFQNQMYAWNLTNQYNSPAAQMERFKQAGLNPNLIYSQQNTSQSSAPAMIHPEFQFPYEQLGSLISSSNVLETASREARNWLDTMQRKKESDSRIEYNTSKKLLADINKDLNVMKYSAFHQGDYFGKMVDNLAKRNFVLKLKGDIDQNTFDFLNRSLDSRIAAIDLKNSLIAANAQLSSERAKSEPARRAHWLAQQRLWNTQGILNNNRSINEVTNFLWNAERNKYRNIYWQGKAAEAYQKPLLMSNQTQLYDSRRRYTDIKAGLAPFEFGLDAINKLGKLGLDAYKTSKYPQYPLRTSNKPLKYR